MIERIIGVFKLDKVVFQDIEHDQSATSQAAIVVAIVAALAVVGSIIELLFNLVVGNGADVGGAIINMIVVFVMSFVNWAIWAGVTFFVE